MRWIRWRGVAAFAVIMALVALVWLVLADWVVRRGIESAGTRLVGAKVELTGADLTLFPAGLTLTGLAVTDPDHPMRNLLAADRVALTFDTAALFERKVIVEEMAVQGARLDTPRRRSGAIAKAARPRTPEETAETDWLDSLPSLDLPDPADLLRREKLQVIARAQALGGRVDDMEAKWRQRVRELPGPEAFAAYKKRVANLEKGGKGLGAAFERAREAGRIKKDLDRDLATLREAGKAFGKDVQTLKAERAALMEGADAEVKRLAERYTPLVTGDAAGIGRLLLGPVAGTAIDQWGTWYDRLLPLFERAVEMRGDVPVVRPMRGTGVDVRFPENHPLPDFLIRHATLSVAFPGGVATGELRDLTPDPTVWDRPCTLVLTGSHLGNPDAVALSALFDHRQPDATLDRVNLRIDGLKAEHLVLAKGGDLPVSLGARLDISGSGELKDGVLDAAGRAQFHDAVFAVDVRGDKPLVKGVADALKRIHAFSLSMRLSGPPDRRKSSIATDIDRQIEAAFRGLLEDQRMAFEERLRIAVTNRLNDLLAHADGRIAKLDGDIPELLAQRSTSAQEMLRGALKSRGGKLLPF